ncbi:hypothetical protein EI32_2815 [Mycobacterium tuberculosis]|nr:hypothetical protein EI32_2815 [Mycobacterium tuberculosis]
MMLEMAEQSGLSRAIEEQMDPPFDPGGIRSDQPGRQSRSSPRWPTGAGRHR